jgi:hypothetical protein
MARLHAGKLMGKAGLVPAQGSGQILLDQFFFPKVFQPRQNPKIRTWTWDDVEHLIRMANCKLPPESLKKSHNMSHVTHGEER